MTDNDVIKALECCVNADCENCPSKTICDSDTERLVVKVFDLINRQKAEIERLKQECSVEVNKTLMEFADRLKIRLERKYTTYGREYVLRHLRELVKEFTEGESHGLA